MLVPCLTSSPFASILVTLISLTVNCGKNHKPAFFRDTVTTRIVSIADRRRSTGLRDAQQDERFLPGQATVAHRAVAPHTGLLGGRSAVARSQRSLQDRERPVAPERGVQGRERSAAAAMQDRGSSSGSTQACRWPATRRDQGAPRDGNCSGIPAVTYP